MIAFLHIHFFLCAYFELNSNDVSMSHKIPKIQFQICTELYVVYTRTNKYDKLLRMWVCNVCVYIHDVVWDGKLQFSTTWVDMTILLTFSNLSSNKVFRVVTLFALYTFSIGVIVIITMSCRRYGVSVEHSYGMADTVCSGFRVAHSSLVYIGYPAAEPTFSNVLCVTFWDGGFMLSALQSVHCSFVYQKLTHSNIWSPDSAAGYTMCYAPNV